MGDVSWLSPMLLIRRPPRSFADMSPTDKDDSKPMYRTIRAMMSLTRPV
jgi:hypothetical protein